MDVSDIVTQHKLRLWHNNVSDLLNKMTEEDPRKKDILRFIAQHAYITRSRFIGPFMEEYNASLSEQRDTTS